MKNVWTIVGAVIALYIVWRLYQGFSAAGGLSSLLGGKTTPSVAGSTGAAAMTPMGSYPYVPTPQQPSGQIPPNLQFGTSGFTGSVNPVYAGWGTVNAPIGIPVHAVGPEPVFGNKKFQVYSYAG